MDIIANIPIENNINTNNCFLLENIVKQLLYKYKYRHVSEKGGTEYYECDIEYIKNIIKIGISKNNK